MTNPYLQGNFAPVSDEITANDLKVIGTLPPDLEGMFLRNGPNPQFAPLGQYHWFDGDGMLHGVKIKDGKASYLNRYVRTFGWQREHEASKAIWTGLLEPPQMDNPYGISKNTANTALVWHNSQLLALWEAGAPHLIDIPTLTTLGEYNYQGKLTSPMTAHPKVDAVTSEMFFFGYSLLQPPYLHYGWVSPDGQLQQLIPIDLPVGVMMHDFAITENYAIFLDLPLTFRLERMQQGQPAFQFEHNLPSRFGIMPRYGDTSQIRWLESESCYIFHTLNAYETDDDVILLACRMSSTNVLGASDIEDAEGNIPRLYQWRFNLTTGQVQEQLLCEIASEFPRLNEQYLGRFAKYGYSAKAAPSPMPLFDGILKHNLEQGQVQVYQFDTGCYGGEPIFVSRPHAQAEDDGWLMTLVHNENTDHSYLLVINAQDLTEVAKIEMPQRVPYGFHGIWLS